MTIEGEFQKIPEPVKKGIEYPILARTIDERVVLFVSETEGIVVAVPPLNKLSAIGSRSAHWVSVKNEDFWRPLAPDECVVLRNVES